ncbi:MAG: DUF4399 domain-containing protein [Ginsengibacter sp.]|jgi:hypothetical protein
MKKFLGIPAILIMGLMSCNSGGNNETTKTDSTVVSADTSHASMNMATTSSLPEIPADAKVFFKNLKDGETVTSPVKVEMGATGISIDSAGAVKPNSGHFHIIVDGEDSIASGEVISKDSTHIHYGNAQQEATLTLPPGKHKLVLQFADGAHRSYGNKLASTVTINVKK